MYDLSLFDRISVRVCGSKWELGRHAAAHANTILTEAISRFGTARLIVATGPSQQELVQYLVRLPNLNWTKIEVFHMDEYVGISEIHPASFRHWLKTEVGDVVRPMQIHYLNGDAADPVAECRRYADLLSVRAIDLCLVGFGENGHIAFNDPCLADFNDSLLVKQVTLDSRCRMQQVGEGHFPDIDAVPREALTITCTAIMACRHLLCCVPDRRKAEAVRSALEGPLSTACPASLVRTHANAALYLDSESASLLARMRVEAPTKQ